MQIATKQQEMHELLMCVAKEVQKIGAHVQLPNVATSTPTSKTAEETERGRRVHKKRNYTTYCDGKMFSFEDMVLVCLMSIFSNFFFALIATKLML